MPNKETFDLRKSQIITTAFFKNKRNYTTIIRMFFTKVHKTLYENDAPYSDLSEKFTNQIKLIQTENFYKSCINFTL